jgi:hypothetical protein
MNSAHQKYTAEAALGLENRFGLRVASALTHQGELAGHDISERLRVAREQALERARLSRRVASHAKATSNQVFGVTASGAALLGGSPMWWTRLASVVPLLTLVLGLVLIDQWHDRAQIDAAADVDSALLADDLPPTAYSDPGFVEFLNSPRE